MNTYEKVEIWAQDRNLINGSNPQAQMVKLMEEMGELAAGIARNNMELIEDSLGDCMVVLCILAQQYNMFLEDCFEAAYDQIKDRKGRMENGVFIKDE